MPVRKQITGLPVRFGGEKHSGWLPSGLPVPEPTPIEDVTLTLQISKSDSGYILEWWDEGKSHVGDTWHQSEEDAMAQAKNWFGVEPHQWKEQNFQPAPGHVR